MNAPKTNAAKKSIRWSFCCALIAGIASAPFTKQAAAEATTTKPASDAAVVSLDAAPVIARIKDAYAKLASLDLAGKITGDFDVDGQKQSPSMQFTTSFSTPNLFRLETTDDALIGNDGSHLYVYAKNRNVFLTADAPKTKVLSTDLPDPFVDLVSTQDPSLALALSSDPATELSDNYSKVEKVDDIPIDNHPFTTLKLQRKDGQGVTTLLIDPQTNLVRRVMMDKSAHLTARGAGVVKKALVTIDYTSVKPNATTRPTEFAWAPPPGARDAADTAGGDDAASQLAGKPAPAFKLKDLADQEVTLASLKGKVVILDFWATWCGPCVGSLPHLNQVYLDFKDKDVHVFAVNQGEEKDLVSGFMHSKNLAVPVLLDGDTKVGNRYGANAIPETVVIGRDGVITKVFIGAGPDTETQLRAAVQSALGDKK